VDVKSDALDVLKTQKPTKLRDNHLRLMIAIAYQAGIAIEDTRFYEASVHAERLAAVGQTITTLSHHIKNILQGLRSGSYLVNMGIEGEKLPLIDQGWKVVQKNQDKIFNLVMDMLSFSKEREPTLESGDLNAVVREVLELMKARGEEHKVEFVMDLDSGIEPLAFDPEGIHRSVLNIVTNAIDALEEVEHDRRIVMKTRKAAGGRFVHLSVSDNGPGIPPDEQKRIFHVFHSTKGSKGTGLGLAVSQKIAHEHGGQIRVESKVGEGATFTIELPIRHLPHASELVDSDAESAISGR
jgi:signal transduction histidine kinase